MAALKRGYTGLGFCLTPPYVGVDLDGCRVQGAEEPWAAEIIRELDSYSELSPSEKGVHVIAKGILPDGPRQKSLEGEHHGVGLYDAARGRYLTMTGCRIRGGGIIPERTAELQRIHARLFPPKAKAQPKTKPGALTDDDVIERARKANDGGKFARLWDGQWKGEYVSQSEADLALSMKLAFWTGRDAGRIDRLFRRSGLMREKWNREDYREATIGKAVAQTTENWTPKPSPSTPRAAIIDLTRFEPSLELLNAMTVFGGRIEFRSVRRRGPMIIAVPTQGQEVIWYSIADLISFSRSQAILADATDVLLGTPSHTAIRSSWEPAAQLILELANRDKEISEPPLKDEFREILRTVWERAGSPAIGAENTHADELFVDLLRQCTSHARDPHAEPPACCIWMAENFTWVHLPSLLDWLSCPVAKSRHFDWSDARKALLLLGFTYIKDCHRTACEKRGKASLWRGPQNLLAY
jgi:hypothetical protein